jgi:hypothetical protein
MRESTLGVEARAAYAQVEIVPVVRQELGDARRTIESRLRMLVPEPEGVTVLDWFRRLRSEVDDAYSVYSERARDVALALRNYNGFVHRVMWAILGCSEEVELATIETCIGPVRDWVAKGQRREVTVTVAAEGLAFPLLRPTHPVILDVGVPIDGLYLVLGHRASIRAREEVDLTLVAIV